MFHARISCFWLLMQDDCVALSLALARAGSNMAARIAMMAITTSNSISVKPVRNARSDLGAKTGFGSLVDSIFVNILGLKLIIIYAASDILSIEHSFKNI